jgi:hypothetical protein
MLVRILLICTLWLAVSGRAEAQVYGYLGHRITIEGKGSGIVAPYFLRSQHDWYGPAIGLAGQYHFAAYFAAWNKISVGISYGGSSKVYEFRRMYRDWVFPENGVRFNTRIVGANIRVYRKQFLAPLGTYFEFGGSKIQYYHASLSDTISTNRYYGRALDISKPVAGFRLSFGYHNSSLLKGRFFMSKGIGFNVISGIKSSIFSQYLSEHERDLLGDISKRIWLENFIQFHIGFGILL